MAGRGASEHTVSLPESQPPPLRPDTVGAGATLEGPAASRPLAAYLAVFAGVLGCVALLSLHPLGNPDTYLHLATGEWMLRHHAIARQNLFMYTTPDYPYLDHTWLAQVIFALLARAVGLVALPIFTALLYGVAFGLVLWIWRRLGAGWRLAIVPFLLGVLFPVGRYELRPELFTYIFLAITMAMALTWREFGGRGIWALPALVAVWVNCHAGVTTGLLFVWVFVACEGLQALVARRWPRPWLPALSFGRWRALALVALAASAALLVNPYGVAWFRAVSPDRMHFLSLTMAEWQPLRARGIAAGPPLWLIFALMGGVALSFPFTRRFYLSNLAVAAAFIGMAFAGYRNLPLTALALLAIMGSNLSSAALHFVQDRPTPRGQGFTRLRRASPGRSRGAAWPALLRRLAPPPEAARRIAAAIGVAAWLVVVGFAWGEPSFWWLGVQVRPGFGIHREFNPVRAEAFWEAKRLPGRLFTTMPYASYVVWKHPEGRPVFVDGNNAYPPTFLEQYLAVFILGPRDETLIRRWNINTIMLPHPEARPNPGESELVAALAASPDWRLIFWDGVSVIYVRDAPENRPFIERYGYAYLNPANLQSPVYLEHPQAVAAELQRAVAASPGAPSLRDFAGLIYLYLGRVDRAAPEFLAGQRLAPELPVFYIGLGLVAVRAGDAAKAETMFREAARLRPPDPAPHRYLAAIAQARGDLRGGLAEWKRVVRGAPNSAADWVGLALAYEAVGDPSRAAAAWRRTLTLKPDAKTGELARAHLAALHLVQDRPGPRGQGHPERSRGAAGERGGR